jgi:hypothetical protein
MFSSNPYEIEEEVFSMDLNQEIMKGEADKNINIHAMKLGHQIMLCKKKTINRDSPHIFLWGGKKPYISDRDEYNAKFKNEQGVFLLSQVGNEYNERNKVGFKPKSREIATVEYFPIKPCRELFVKLKEIGEFALWDIDEGPMKLFTEKGRLLNSGKIAIYRVYKLPKNLAIRQSDLIFEGNTPKLKAESFERLREALENYNLSPVDAKKVDGKGSLLNNMATKGDHFKERKGKILDVIYDLGR